MVDKKIKKNQDQRWSHAKVKMLKLNKGKKKGYIKYNKGKYIIKVQLWLKLNLNWFAVR